MMDSAKEWLADNDYRGFRIVACFGSFWIFCAPIMGTIWFLPMFLFGFTSPAFFVFNVIYSIKYRHATDIVLSIFSLLSTLLNLAVLNEFANG